jgi:hypothetical protein
MVHELFQQQPPTRKMTGAASSQAIPAIEDYGAFGWLSNPNERPIMLEIRHANGNITALCYALLESAEFKPSLGITLNFSATSVKLVGRNLNEEARPGTRLFEGIARHRVLWIQEGSDDSSRDSLETDVVIEEVEVMQ